VEEEEAEAAVVVAVVEEEEVAVAVVAVAVAVVAVLEAVPLAAMHPADMAVSDMVRRVRAMVREASATVQVAWVTV
jgi:hypothetical protein